MDKDKVASIFLKEKPLRALMTIKNLPRSECYGRTVSSSIDATYAHTTNIIDRLHSSDLITKDKQARKNTLRLTEKGEEVAESLSFFEDCFQEKDRDSV